MKKKITFDTTTYRRTYGVNPRGIGGWAFLMGKADCDDINEKDAQGRPIIWWAPSGFTFTEARKWATTEAKRRGVTLVGVCT